jgi:Flp pilus assembly pilin Flp
MKRIAKLISDHRGATTIEYAAVASIISIAAVAGMSAIGTSVLALFQTVPNF